MKVGKIAKNVQERSLKWYGHVMSRADYYVGRRVTEMKVQTWEKEEKMAG